jgi:hypothetical protein
MSRNSHITFIEALFRGSFINLFQLCQIAPGVFYCLDQSGGFFRGYRLVFAGQCSLQGARIIRDKRGKRLLQSGAPCLIDLLPGEADRAAED